MENISFRNTSMLVHLFFFLRENKEIEKNELQFHLVNNNNKPKIRGKKDGKS